MEEKTFSQKGIQWLLAASLVFSFFFVSAGATQAASFEESQDNAFRESLELYGAFVEDLAVGTDGYVYAGTSGPNGFYASGDQGENWSGLSSDYDLGAVSDVEAGNGDGVVFMIAGIDLYRSEDNGTTWEQLSDEDGNDFGQFMTFSGDTLYVVKRDGRIATFNNGGTVQNILTVDEAATSVSSVAEASGTLYALAGGEGSDNTLYFSTDDGSTWSEAGQSGEYTVLGAHPSDADYVVMAGRDGAKYTENGTDGPWVEMNLPDGGNAGFVLITESNTVYIGPQYTANNGSSWSTFQGTVSSRDSVIKGQQAFVIDVSNNYYYIQSGRGVAFSEDQVNWEDRVNGMLAVSVGDISQDETKDEVWVALQGGFAHSSDFYSAIEAGNQPTWDYPVYPDITDDDQSSDVDSGTAVWVKSEDSDIVMAAQDGAVWRSTDGGDTWSSVSIDLESENRGGTNNIFEDVDNGKVYLTYSFSEGGDNQDESGGGIYVSEDDGATWTDMALDDVPAGPVAVDSDGNVIVGVGNEMDETDTLRGLYMYDGSSWTHLTDDSSGALYQGWVKDIVYSSSEDTLYVTTGASSSVTGGVFYSTDAGTWESWTAAADIPSDFWGQSLALEVGTPGALYASTARPSGTGSIYKCRLDGSSCTQYYEGLKDELFNTLLFDGLISGSSAGLFQYKSKVTLTLRKQQFRKGSAKRQAGKIKLVATLKDKATGKKLNGKKVQLMVKKKRNGRYRPATKANGTAKKKRVQRGSVTFVVQRRATKNTWYKVRFVPRGAAAEVYQDRTVSRARKVPKLN